MQHQNISAGGLIDYSHCLQTYHMYWRLLLIKINLSSKL